MTHFFGAGTRNDVAAVRFKDNNDYKLKPPPLTLLKFAKAFRTLHKLEWEQQDKKLSGINILNEFKFTIPE